MMKTEDRTAESASFNNLMRGLLSSSPIAMEDLAPASEFWRTPFTEESPFRELCYTLATHHDIGLLISRLDGCANQSDQIALLFALGNIIDLFSECFEIPIGVEELRAVQLSLNSFLERSNSAEIKQLTDTLLDNVGEILYYRCFTPGD